MRGAGIWFYFQFGDIQKTPRSAGRTLLGCPLNGVCFFPHTLLVVLDLLLGDRWSDLLVHKCHKVCAQSLIHVRLFATPCAIAHQAPLSTGILQARILKWVAIFSSRGSSQPRDHIPVYHCATWEALREFNDITSIKSLPENT